MRSKPTFGANQMTPRLKPETKPAPKSKIDIWAEEGIENLAGKSWREMQKDREALQDREISERIRRALTSKPVRPFIASIPIKAKCDKQIIQALRTLTVNWSCIFVSDEHMQESPECNIWIIMTSCQTIAIYRLGISIKCCDTVAIIMWALLSTCWHPAIHDMHLMVEQLYERMWGRYSESKSLMQRQSMRSIFRDIGKSHGSASAATRCLRSLPHDPHLLSEVSRFLLPHHHNWHLIFALVMTTLSVDCEPGYSCRCSVFGQKKRPYTFIEILHPAMLHYCCTRPNSCCILSPAICTDEAAL